MQIALAIVWFGSTIEFMITQAKHSYYNIYQDKKVKKSMAGPHTTSLEEQCFTQTSVQQDEAIRIYLLQVASLHPVISLFSPSDITVYC